MNLIADLRTIITKEFQAEGKNPTATDIEQMLYQFFNIFMKKQVVAKPRSIFTSKELEQKKSNNPIWLQDFMVIVGKIENGDDINEHLSKLSVNAKYNDPMLNDWGIHHIHLSTTKKTPSQKFYDRSAYLLLAFFQDDVTYLIEVLPHPDHQDKVFWSQKNIIEIINNNWGKLLENWQLKGVVGTERNTSDIERSQLREVHINSPIQLGGQVFMGPGGGTTAAGTSVEVQMSCDNLLENLERFQTIDDVQQLIVELDSARTGDTDFTLVLEEDQFYIIGCESGIKINVAY
jgi:hypothetical protein